MQSCFPDREEGVGWGDWTCGGRAEGSFGGQKGKMSLEVTGRASGES